MRLKHYLLAFVLLIAITITACDVSPKSLVESHLNLLKSGKVDEAFKQYCDPRYKQELRTIRSLRIEESKTRYTDKYPKFEYTTVDISFETDQSSQERKTAFINVWKTDDYYENERQSVSKPLSMYSRNPETVNRGREAYEAYLPKREDFSRNRQCLVVIVRSS